MPAAFKPPMMVHTPTCFPCDARESVGHGDRIALLAHHQDRHILFPEGIVHVIGGIAGDQGTPQISVCVPDLVLL